MFDIYKIDFSSKEDYYDNILLHAKGLIMDETNLIANLANISALLYHTMEKINWAGFYLYKNNQLILGPFQGKPACVRIDIGVGVCGMAAKLLATQVVENVHEFSGHIACDSSSNSEIVIPIIVRGRLGGVLDIDSQLLNRFDEIDSKYLNELVKMIVQQCEW